jgi:hypothetical protein
VELTSAMKATDIVHQAVLLVLPSLMRHALLFAAVACIRLAGGSVQGFPLQQSPPDIMVSAFVTAHRVGCRPAETCIALMPYLPRVKLAHPLQHHMPSPASVPFLKQEQGCSCRPPHTADAPRPQRHAMQCTSSHACLAKAT